MLSESRCAGQIYQNLSYEKKQHWSKSSLYFIVWEGSFANQSILFAKCSNYMETRFVVKLISCMRQN